MCRPNAAAALIKALLLLLVIPLASASGIYRWVDADGRVHFSDRPLQQNAETITLKQKASGWQPMAIQVTTAGSLQNRPLPLDMARIQREVNWIYRFYQQTLYFDFLRSVPVNIQLLENRAEYIRHVWDTAQWDASKTLGVYMPKTHSIVLYLHDEKTGGLESTYATIRHEVSHAILHSLTGRLPDWLNEGMAEQMETLGFSGNAFTITAHPRNKRGLLARRQQAMPVLQFVELRSDHWRKSNHQHGINQEMAGQLVYMLLSTDYGRSLITRLLQDYKRGVNMRSYYLLDQHYIGGAKALEIHWNNWLVSNMAAPAQIEMR